MAGIADLDPWAPKKSQGQGIEALDPFSPGYLRPDTTAGDVAKSLGAGAVDALGYGLQGIGNLGAQAINRGAEALTGFNPLLRADNPLGGVSKRIRDSRTEGGRLAQELSTPTGSIDDLSGISFGEAPTVGGYLQNVGDVIGQFAAPAAVAIATRGRGGAVGASIGAAQGALTAGGAAADQAGDSINALDDAALTQKSSRYRDYLAAGLSPAEARQRTVLDAQLGAGTIGALPAAIEGALLPGLLQGRFKLPAVGGSPAAQVAGAAGIGGIGEGLQEVVEGVAGQYGQNLGAGMDTPLLEGSAANAILGFAGGAVAGGGIKALETSRRQDEPTVDPLATQRAAEQTVAQEAQRAQDIAGVAAAAQAPDAGPLTKAVGRNPEATAQAAPMDLKSAFSEMQARQAQDEKDQATLGASFDDFNDAVVQARMRREAAAAPKALSAPAPAEQVIEGQFRDVTPRDPIAMGQGRQPAALPSPTSEDPAGPRVVGTDGAQGRTTYAESERARQQRAEADVIGGRPTGIKAPEQQVVNPKTGQPWGNILAAQAALRKRPDAAEFEVQRLQKGAFVLSRKETAASKKATPAAAPVPQPKTDAVNASQAQASEVRTAQVPPAGDGGRGADARGSVGTALGGAVAERETGAPDAGGGETAVLVGGQPESSPALKGEAQPASSSTSGLDRRSEINRGFKENREAISREKFKKGEAVEYDDAQGVYTQPDGSSKKGRTFSGTVEKVLDKEQGTILVRTPAGGSATVGASRLRRSKPTNTDTTATPAAPGVATATQPLAEKATTNSTENAASAEPQSSRTNPLGETDVRASSGAALAGATDGNPRAGVAAEAAAAEPIFGAPATDQRRLTQDIRRSDGSAFPTKLAAGLTRAKAGQKDTHTIEPAEGGGFVLRAKPAGNGPTAQAETKAGAAPESKEPTANAKTAVPAVASPDGDWEGFEAGSGTLGIPRADMPQVKAEHRGALVNFLAGKGVTHAQAEIDPTTLKPTQAEFSPGKVKKAKSFKGGDRSILVSSDEHIIDGHHQWLAKRDGGEKVKVIRLDSPAKDLLPLVREFPSSSQEAGATAAPAVAEQIPAREKSPVAEKKSEQTTPNGNTAEAAGTKAAMFRMAPPTSNPMPRDQLNTLVRNVLKSWDKAPPVVVLDSMADPATPETARRHYVEQTLRGATGAPRAFILRGTVYLVADQIATPKAAAEALFHEALGHWGLRRVFGKELGGILQSIATLRRADVDAKVHSYGFDPKDPASPLRAAEEVLAEMAQYRPEMGFVRRAIAAIRSWLRRNGFGKLAFSNDELIRSFILPARQYVEAGRTVSGQKAPAAGELRPAFSLKGVHGSDRTEWGSFPPVHHMAKLGTTQKHPEYAAAKAGDHAAAVRVVTDTLDDVKIEELRRAIGDMQPIIVPVTALERAGRNQIPRAYAIALGDRLGLQVDEGIVQSVRAFHTDADAFQRIASQPAFDGPVVAGQDYLIVDDTQTIGGTLTNLRGHIEASGGKVLLASTLTGFPQSADIALRPSMRDSLRQKHGQALEDFLQQQFGFGIDRLTQGEAGHLRRAPSLDVIRDRLAEGRRRLGLAEDPRSDGGAEGEAGGVEFQLADQALERLRDRVAVFNDSTKTFNGWWHKTVGTQYHKAQIDADYRRVFDRTQQYLTDVSRYALGAADQAQEILPRFESISDLAKSGASPRDLKPVASAIFQGTLNYVRGDDGKPRLANDEEEGGIVFSAAELRSLFGLNEKQVRLYQQARASIRRSLEDLAVTDMVKVVRNEISEATALRAAAAPSPAAAREILAAAVKPESLRLLDERVERVGRLTAKGYAPLMRFGRYSVYVTDAQGEALYYGMFEEEADARRVEREMRGQYPQATVQRGVVSEESFKMFQGMSPDTLELFAEVTGMGQNEAFQQYLKLAKNNRSALKRLIKRKGIEGYNPDLKRVLAQFVTSNGRAASANLHLGELTKAWSEIPKEKGDVKDEAAQLIGYMQNPQEEAAKLRGLLFFNFIGGSIASAMVNMTQPVTMTLPYLAQWGARRAGAELTKAMRVGFLQPTDADTRAAMDRAHREGIVEPHQIFELQGAAMRSEGNWGKADRLRETWGKGMFLWGRMFSYAEQFNRRSTFAAAYRIGKQLDAPQLAAAGVKDAYDFAVKAVNETQGIYNRGNRPDWARGAVGATLFTFKQFSISYLEFLKRLPRRERVMALGVLVLAAGVNGLPGSDDLDDLIDTLAQQLGYSWNTKAERNKLVERVVTPMFGQAGADFVKNGVSAVLPIDVQARMGLGNLIPGTAVALKSNPDSAREFEEAIGPAAGFVGGIARGVGKALTADSPLGAISGGLAAGGPVAVRNVFKAYDMQQMGFYRDEKGRRVIDTDGADALAKVIGFQPATVAVETRKLETQRQDIDLAKTVESEIADKWAQGVFEKDSEKVTAAREQLRRWNARNPETPIRIGLPQIGRRVKEMRQTRAERFIKAAPKELRGQVSEALAP